MEESQEFDLQSFKNVNVAFNTLYNLIDKEIEEPNFDNTKAISNCSFQVNNVLDRTIVHPERKFKQSYAEYEWNWYLSGDRNAFDISEKAKIWKKMFVKDTTEVNSNYGYFWNKNNQLNRVIDLLKSNPSTRRAIIVHYDIDELDRYPYDTPCNVVLNFQVLDNKLNLTVFARSIDLWYGFCNDFYTFSKLMEMVSEKVGYEVGYMHWFITNLHLYPDQFNKNITYKDYL